ncbi:MAG TPA: IclR family transcriptional regulator [Gaiellaceae bacterium]|nr:IclR family transcriptional regulator [Gaiellaceae bacterium]
MAAVRASDGAGQTIDRAADVLTALGAADGPLGATELAEHAGLPLSSTYRLVQSLERHGFVERRPRRGIALGLRVLELARRAEDRLELALLEPARGPMQELARECSESVLLTAPAGVSAIGLDSVEGSRPIRLTYGRWRLAPIHRGASGKVLLAHLDAEQAGRALDAAATLEPELDFDRLRRELAEIRRRGHAVSHGELDQGASGVAAPILDPSGRLLAGVTVAGPTERVRPAEAELGTAVTAAARRIETAVGDAWQ